MASNRQESHTMRWSLLISLAVAVLFTLGAGAPVSAQGIHDGHHTAQIGNSQIFNDDLVVEEGQQIYSNVVLYDGDAKIKEGGRIDGNLVVYSGDIEVLEGGSIAGDVTAFSGDIKIKGAVEGNVASWSGDVDLEDNARVDGDISVLSGDIDRDDDAYVGGNIVRGPSFNLKVPAMIAPLGPTMEGAESEVVVTTESSGPGFLERIGNFVLRLMIGFGLTIIFVPLAGLIAYSKPEYIGDVERVIKTQAPLSFAAGLMTNVIVGLLTAFLVMTLCLALFAVVPFFALVGLNIVGWTAVSGIVGKRLCQWLKIDSSTAVQVVLGALALAAVTVPFFALGGCFRFIAFVVALLIGAFGVGGVLLTWREKRYEGRQLPPPPPAGHLEASESQDPQPDGGTKPAPTAQSDTSGAERSMTAPSPPPPAPPEDDFTEIDAVNAVMDARLKVAGIRTFEALAGQSPETLAGIFSWTPEEVVSEQIIEKASLLANLD